MKCLLTLLRGERGSAAASVAFTLFTALILTAVTASVVSSMSLTSAIGSQTSANSATHVLQEQYLTAVASGATPPTSACTGPFCAHVLSTTDSTGLRTVTFQNPAVAPGTTTEAKTFRQVSGTLVGGYDSLGRPVWADRKDMTPYRFENVRSMAGHSCALDTAKAAWCWGTNTDGQLGDGTTTHRNAPVKVSTAALFASLPSGGATTSCGLTDTGRALCWGDNTHGQLGTGSTTVGTDSTTPVEPTGGRTFTLLAQSSTTACGIDAAKKTWCWGKNPGNGTANPSPAPTEVVGGHQFTSLSPGSGRTCGIDGGGKAWCWSAKYPPTDPLSALIAPPEGTPVEVAGGRTYKSIHVAPNADPLAKNVICAVAITNATWCWGDNADGQLGNGTTTSSKDPVQVTGSHLFSALAVTVSTVCGIDGTSRLLCWGDNTNGQVGNGTTTDASNPVVIDTGVTYKNVAAGAGSPFFCGATTAGSAKCWGVNANGQSAPGTTADVTVPTAIADLSNVKTVSASTDYVCATDRRSGVSCWGKNDTGQAGNGTTSASTPPGTGIRREIAPTTFQGFVKGGL